jgi:hypothetical protein
MGKSQMTLNHTLEFESDVQPASCSDALLSAMDFRSAYTPDWIIDAFQERANDRKQQLSPFRCGFTCLRSVEKGLERSRPREPA